MRLLVFGSRQWQNAALISNLLHVVCPTVLIEGEAEGADKLAREAAFFGIEVEGYPVDTAIDGPWPAAGHRRNARMERDGKPDAAIGLISGKVGTPFSRGSAGMARILTAKGKPLVVYRDDGIEPLFVGGLVATLQACRDALAALYPLRREHVRPAGEAMAVALRERGAGDSVLAASSALEVLGEVAPDLAPWVGAVQVTLRPWVR